MPEPVFTNADQAAQALAAAARQDAEGGQPAPAEPVTPNQPEQPTTTGQPPQGEAPATDSFTDLSAALEGIEDPVQRQLIETRFGQMQGDYTRKTQDLSREREEAQQAIQFVEALNSDPNFALRVRDEIQTALEASGFSEQEARAEANAQVQEAAQPGESGLEPDDPIVRELQELKEWRAETEARQLQQEMENEFDRMDVAVRQANPDLGEEDMAHVYALSYATGGDLFEAVNAYKQESQRILERYMAGKQGQVDSTPSTPSSSGSAQEQPSQFDGLFDPELMAAAQRMLSESLGQ